MTLPKATGPFTKYGKTHYIADYSEVEVEAVDLKEVFGEEWSPFKSEHYTTQVHSPDLKSLFVRTSFGLTLGLFPSAPGSFFQSTLDDDSSYKLLCSCFARLKRSLASDQPFYVCPVCSAVTPYIVGKTDTLWLSPSGRKLSVAKAGVREERAANAFNVVKADELSEAINKHDFTGKLVEWVEPLSPNTLEAHVYAWDLIDTLEELWLSWKHVKKARSNVKRLAGFRSLQQHWGGPEVGLIELPFAVEVELSTKEFDSLRKRNLITF